MSKRDTTGKPKLRCYDENYVKLGFIRSRQDEHKAECFLCGDILSNDAMKPSKLETHLKTKHEGSASQDLAYFQRKKELYISNRPTSIKDSFRNVTKQLDKATEASFIASLAIAKLKKPHNIGESLIKPVLVDVVSLMCGDAAADKVKTVPMSDNTVKRRIDTMASDCEGQLIATLKSTKFAIQLDESTTVTNEALLLVCVRYIAAGEINEDLLFSDVLDTTTRGEDIFLKVDNFFSKHELPYNNLVACCTDGAAAMMGKNVGFNTRLKRVAPHCKIIHCVLHRQALAARKLSPELNDTLNTSVKMINQIKSKALNSRLFKQLCESNDEIHTTLLLHMEVRWLPRGRTLGRLYELRECVYEMLLEIDSEHAQIFTDSNFQTALAYLVDLFDHYNNFNLKLQGEGVNVLICKEAVDGFRRKLSVWHGKVVNNEFGMFQELSQLCRDTPICPNFKQVILTHLNALKTEIMDRFEDISDANEYSFVLNPFTAKLDDISDPKEEEELIDIQASVNKQRYFEMHGCIKFWINEGRSIAPNLTNTALNKAILPFVTSYLAESTFSSVVQIKSQTRNRLLLHHDLRLAVTNIKPNIKELAQQLQAQGCH